MLSIMTDYSRYKFAIKQILESKAGHQIPQLKEELEEKLGISRTWLNKIINARVGSRYKLDHVQLVLISAVLNCSIDELITKEGKEAINKTKKSRKQ